MRVLLGMIIGAALTIGGAYISDTWPTGPAASSTIEHRSMVNWDVVSDNFAVVRDAYRKCGTGCRAKCRADGRFRRPETKTGRLGPFFIFARQRSRSSWLSLATRSNASPVLLIRY